MKPITRIQFRVLLTLSVIAFIASPLVGVLTDAWLLPRDLQDYLAAHRTERPRVGDVVIGLLGAPGLVGGIIAIIGLYNFRPNARWLAVASWAYMLVWMPFSGGAVIESPLAGAFSQCAALLVGAVLALVYFSSAADWFLGCLPEPAGRSQRGTAAPLRGSSDASDGCPLRLTLIVTHR